MKKLIFIFTLLLSLSIFAVDKTGIAEIDNLVYSKGKTITFFDESGNPSKTKTGSSAFERKIYDYKADASKGKMYIVADYYVSNKQLAYVFITSEKNINVFEPEDIVSGYTAVFNEDGTLVTN